MDDRPTRFADPVADPVVLRMRRVNETVAQRLKTARREAELSQSDVGAALGRSFQQVQKYENGRNRASAGVISIYAALTGHDITWFFGILPPAHERNFVVRLGRLFVAEGEGRFTRWADEAARYGFAEAQAMALLDPGCAVHAPTDFSGDAYRSPDSLRNELRELREAAHG